MKYKALLYFIILVLLGACKPEMEEFKTDAGSADFTRYASLGDSYASGFSDGAISQGAQENSYGNILASRFASVGGSTFKQPLLSTPNDMGVGFQPTPQGLYFTTKYALGYRTDCLGVTSLGPVLAKPDASQNELQGYLLAPVADQGPFNNTGVPGTKIGAMLLPGYAGLNPYFARFSANPQADVLLALALEINPTFYTLWIGNYDILGYAISGGASDAITELPFFQGALNNIMDQLAASGAEGAIANIPDVSDIPFFTTIPINGLQLNDSLAGLLNMAYAPYNAGAAQIGVPQITFQAGYNYFVIEDTNAPYNLLGGLRQIREGEFLLMSVPQDSLKCAGWGSQLPIPGRYTLIQSELSQISNATNGYNEAIRTAADGKAIAHVDMNAAFATLNDYGFIIDGIALSNEFVSGNVFSLDGLHLTGQGNAWVANLFIKEINSFYNASIPQANITEYPAVIYP